MTVDTGSDGYTTDTDDLSVLHLVTAEEVFFRQQIKALEQKGVECHVCVVPGADQIDGDLGSRRGLIEYLRYFPKVHRALRNGSFDLIHANYGLTAPYAVTQFRLPVVLTLWGSDVIGFDGFVTKACAWRADAITVRSKEMREILGRKGAHIVPSGVDMERFHPMDHNDAREQIGWSSDGVHVLFPYSPDYERKNYPLAERVVKNAEKELNIDISLHTMSGVPHDRVPYYMNAADCVLLTSDHEGSPNTVKEAMACNVPVVSTNVGDVKERLNGIERSYVGEGAADLTTGLCQVLSSNVSVESRSAVENISWNAISEDMINIYNSVIGSK